MVDAGDLKSPDQQVVPVRLRPALLHKQPCPRPLETKRIKLGAVYQP